MLSSNNIKIIGIMLYVLNRYNLEIIIDLYKERIKRTMSIKHLLLGIILFKSYKKKNITNDLLFIIIDNYIKNHSTKYLRYLIVN